MGGACSAISNAFSGPSNPTGDSGGAPRGSTMNRPANSFFTTLKMDLGLEPKNDAYDRELPERARRTSAIVDRNMANMLKDDKRLTSGPVASAPVASSGISAASSAPSSDAVKAAGEAAFDDVDSSASPGASVGTAAGGKELADTATSVGGAEDDALKVATKGRRSTILTKPGGLLDSEEDTPTRRRRSLIG